MFIMFLSVCAKLFLPNICGIKLQRMGGCVLPWAVRKGGGGGRYTVHCTVNITGYSTFCSALKRQYHEISCHIFALCICNWRILT